MKETAFDGAEGPVAIVLSAPQAEQVVVGSKYAESVTDRETYSYFQQEMLWLTRTRWRNIQNISGEYVLVVDGGEGPGAIVLSPPPGCYDE